jgi:hypothetical protein
MIARVQGRGKAREQFVSRSPGVLRTGGHHPVLPGCECTVHLGNGVPKNRNLKEN